MILRILGLIYLILKDLQMRVIQNCFASPINMEKRLWMFLFFAVLSGYALYYAPYGIDESDGGFMTGLAWQWLSGKALYSELLYARPPLPVWLRAATLCILPDQWAILGERWVFYAQVGLYSWLGASLLAQGAQRLDRVVRGAGHAVAARRPGGRADVRVHGQPPLRQL